ncbi:hypothetical protein EVAR_64706_1 [Eumeta japonica]|uniref:Uncharacterized protein n=1 Tax=Eumeta variegata TaxID=151549 RepID=A0A4C1ZME6_EUMVA|nr:hypothetical protein EVAR_64706_1 [Eumeta japonica]
MRVGATIHVGVYLGRRMRRRMTGDKMSSWDPNIRVGPCFCPRFLQLDAVANRGIGIAAGREAETAIGNRTEIENRIEVRTECGARVRIKRVTETEIRDSTETRTDANWIGIDDKIVQYKNEGAYSMSTRAKPQTES